ncbi:MAG: four helix bundle protein [Bacillota bacterium]
MTNDQTRMTNEGPKPNRPKGFDLEDRTAQFGVAVLAFAKTIPMNEITRPLIGQLVRSATSVGANYVEADDADSKKDFRFKIGLCRREAKETKHWLRMISAAEPTLRDAARELWREAQELNLIFSAIRRKTTQ